MQPSTDDKLAIDTLTALLYAAFRNEGGITPDLDSLHDVFLPECVITKAVEQPPQIESLQDFITQRRALLTGGRLVHFSEWETDEHTWTHGHVASRWSLYSKSGVLDGKSFNARGIKNIQFVKAHGRWWISALAWDDERPGLVPPEALITR